MACPMNGNKWHAVADSLLSPPRRLRIVLRRPLASEENIVEHDAGSGQEAFSFRRRDATASVAGVGTCSSLIIEPMEWIDGLADGHVEGKIVCPKCNSKLGSYKWSGGYMAFLGVSSRVWKVAKFLDGCLHAGPLSPMNRDAVQLWHLGYPVICSSPEQSGYSALVAWMMQPAIVQSKYEHAVATYVLIQTGIT